MFSEKYLKKNHKKSWGMVDPTKLNWDVVKKEGEGSTMNPEDYIDTGSGGNDDDNSRPGRQETS